MRYKYLLNIVLFLIITFVVSCDSKKGKQQTPQEKIVKKEIEIRFTEITEEAGIDFKHESGAYGEFFMPEIYGSGAAFIDYNGDHWQDILLVGGGAFEKSERQIVQGLALYHNNGDGTFTQVTNESGLRGVKAYCFGISVGDYDGDGDDDFYVTSLTQNLLFRNDGGIFKEVAKKAGVAGGKAWSTASIFFDADQDGFLDLYVGNYVKWSQKIDRNIWCSLDGETDNYCHPDLYDGEQGVYYHNNGDGTFNDKTKVSGFIGGRGIAPIKTLGLAQIDFDHNGWPDLVMTIDMKADLLFQNLGDGTFEEVGIKVGIAYNSRGKPRAGMGIAIGDIDNSGYESIIVGNFSRQPISVYRSMSNGLFRDIAYATQIGKPSFITLTFGLSLFDADLDGDLDLATANGHVFYDIEKTVPQFSFRQPQHFFVNNGKGIFTDKAKSMGSYMSDSLVARASAYADIDLDGDLDLLITENNGPAHLLRNDTQTSNHYLRILARLREGNTNAIGAKMELYFGGGKRQIRYVKSSDSYQAQSEFPITFGLGRQNKIDSLIVIWPGGDKVSFDNISPDSFIEVVKGKGYKKIL